METIRVHVPKKVKLRLTSDLAGSLKVIVNVHEHKLRQRCTFLKASMTLF